MLRSGGKRLRPALMLLMARSVGASSHAMKRVAQLAVAVEVLHSASLVHDDILDLATSRRGSETMHVRCGELPAVLIGDYLFAMSTSLVSDLDSMPAILLVSKVIADFGRGELAQSASKYEAKEYSLRKYLAKSFHKTASLIAAACRGAVALGNEPVTNVAQEEAGYRYGLYVGLAFQVVDDILDFTETSETLGKPALADLKSGYVSAPVHLALEEGRLASHEREALTAILERHFDQDGDFDVVLNLINRAKGLERSEELARKFSELAVAELETIPSGPARDALKVFADFVVSRSS